MKSISKHAQEGLSLIEILLWLSLAVVVGTFAANQFGNVSAGAKRERAYAEIEKVRGAAQAFRTSPKRAGSFTGVTIAVLATQGYNVNPLTTGLAENAYGKNITLIAASSGTDATLTYQTANNEDCLQLTERFTNSPGLSGAPSCATNTLTLTLD